MNAKLEFNLEDPDHVSNLNRCLKSKDITIALWSIQQRVRHKIKYDENMTDEESLIWHDFNNIINEEMENSRVNLDELIQ